MKCAHDEKVIKIYRYLYPHNKKRSGLQTVRTNFERRIFNVKSLRERIKFSEKYAPEESQILFVEMQWFLLIIHRGLLQKIYYKITRNT